MFCEFCGQVLPDEAIFCPSCGARVVKHAAPVSEYAVDEPQIPSEPEQSDYQAVTEAEPEQSDYQVTKESAPEQPAYAQPQYGAPAQSTYQPPQYGAPAQSTYQPQYGAPAQSAYQPQYGAPVRPVNQGQPYGAPARPVYQQPQYGAVAQPQYQAHADKSGTSYPLSMVFALIAALGYLATVIVFMIDYFPNASYYSSWGYGGYYIYTLIADALVFICSAVFFFQCLNIRKGSAASTGIPLVIMLLPTLIGTASWLFKFEVFNVRYSFNTVGAIANFLLIGGVVMYIIALKVRMQSIALRAITAVILLGYLGLSAYTVIDAMISVFKYYPTALSVVSMIALLLSVLFLPAAMIAILLKEKEQ